jgi:DNA (cytosine-5)-methyltransferase 1
LGNAAGGGQRKLRHASLPGEGRYLDGSSDAPRGVGNPERLGTRWNAGTGAGPEGGDWSGYVGDDARASGANDAPSPTNGLWRDADWLLCRDGKWRPVEPGTFPLAHGAPARVGRLRGYGNAINAEAARVFIEAVIG